MEPIVHGALRSSFLNGRAALLAAWFGLAGRNYPDVRDCRSTRFDLDELPGDLAIAGGAEEIAFLRCAVVIVPADRAAAVGGQHRVARVSFGEAVEVAVKDGDEIEILEALEDFIGIERPVPDIRPQWKMSEHHGGSRGPHFRQPIVEPF